MLWAGIIPAHSYKKDVMMMTYDESLIYLENLCKFGINLGLTRIEKLLELMDHPERRFKTIHITGTNGKGSTTAMLTAILTSAGIKTGMYTSPHLWDYTERIVVDGLPISPCQFAEAIEYTSQFVDQIIQDGLEHPTEFEVLTAAAFHHFASCGVEYAVIEVGLGGLLDSTNVIVPEVAVITNVTLDHIDKCGNTIADIAKHKAGIIKEGVTVVTGAQGEALRIIRAAAREKTAVLYVFGQEFSANFAGLVKHQQKVTIKTTEEVGTFLVNLLGHHQVDNCALAVMTAMQLGKKEERITLVTIQKGLAEVCWPGRFEVIPGDPTLIIDGAHNLDGARILRKNLDTFYAGKEIVFLLGILQDKDVKGIVNSLIRCNDKVVVVAPMSERAGNPKDIAREIEAAHIETAESIREGLSQAYQLAGEEGILCIAGSLYLIGSARKIICE